MRNDLLSSWWAEIEHLFGGLLEYFWFFFIDINIESNQKWILFEK